MIMITLLKRYLKYLGHNEFGKIMWNGLNQSNTLINSRLTTG